MDNPTTPQERDMQPLPLSYPKKKKKSAIDKQCSTTVIYKVAFYMRLFLYSVSSLVPGISYTFNITNKQIHPEPDDTSFIPTTHRLIHNINILYKKYSNKCRVMLGNLTYQNSENERNQCSIKLVKISLLERNFYLKNSMFSKSTCQLYRNKTNFRVDILRH
jgi:hypothetical protein